MAVLAGRAGRAGGLVGSWRWPWCRTVGTSSVIPVPSACRRHCACSWAATGPDLPHAALARGMLVKRAANVCLGCGPHAMGNESNGEVVSGRLIAAPRNGV